MEAYPMPLFVKLEVQNMTYSLNWYKEVLQFTSVFELADQQGNSVMAHIRGEKYQDIMLLSSGGKSNEGKKGQGVTLNVAAKEIEPFYKRAAQFSPANVVEGPVNRPWNARELVLQDPDGYLITLSMVIDQSRAFDDVMG
ncbi:glyoxalase/bleomycin resistance/extradiol dioxygenase family protein [Bacillus lacus]|uniref:Glyoxalase/bleomycin resistance/extradiol dioxygenase family protein n=1 Tax=Metabacillus lacus TaxID=1983721 RepID=A0A7X2J313_9BACI|nr:VOC family protein [Metabacillus lacus]MRX74409.1 glyoxalase/bleomycin resistance/extradiol dioxygenase family protein [Metabacillus lacus]